MTSFDTQSSDVMCIYDAAGALLSALLDTLSGSLSTMPIEYSTSQRYMLVVFTSQAVVNGFNGGFSATYNTSTTSPGMHNIIHRIATQHLEPCLVFTHAMLVIYLPLGY